MANRRFYQFYQTLHQKPVQLDCQFTVARTNNKGVTGLIGPGIQAVYMHTSTTPSALNPNPADGNIIVQLEDNYNFYYGGDHQVRSPASGTDVAVILAGSPLTVGTVYQISALGTTTTAEWHSLGVPAGTAPAVGVAFTALLVGLGTGTGKVQTANLKHSGISSIELFGNPNLSIKSSIGAVTGAAVGPYMMFKCLSSKFISFTATTHTNTTVDGISSTARLAAGQLIAGTGIPLGATISSVDSATAITISAAATASATVTVTAGPYMGLTQPEDGSIISMNFLLSNTAITIQGD